MDINDIKVTLTTSPKQKPTDESSLGFGKYFSDHMFIVEYSPEQGWHDPRIEPYHRLSLDPASSVLHYAQEIFEGLKAYRRDDGGIQLFRAIENCRRLNRSADRMNMPGIDEEFNMEAMRMLTDIERDWVPTQDGTSLYLRPTMIANDEALGVHAAHNYIYYVICSPSGAYYKNGLTPINIHVEHEYVRAVKGGMGEAKTGGNYACSIRAGEDAAKQGFSQVLWLDGKHNKYVQEVGAMNMMFVVDGKVITAPLDGTILPGVTRNSVLTLVRDMGYEAEERPIDIDELMQAGREGRLQEAFGTGTAATISPVGLLEYKGERLTINNGEIGELSMKLYNTLMGIQRGRVEDKFGWITKVC